MASTHCEKRAAVTEETMTLSADRNEEMESPVLPPESTAESRPKKHLEADFEHVLGTHMETKFVTWLKLLVLLILVTSAVCVALFIYYYTSRGEQNRFEERFYDDAHKVLEAVGSGLDLTLEAIDSHAVNVVSYARASNQSWPFVTVPDFAVRMAKIRALSQAVVAGQFHFVDGVDREKWEEYSIENQGWVEESLRVQAEDDTFHGVLLENYTVSDKIWDISGVSTGEGPFLPFWQSAPVIPFYPPFNWNGFKSSTILAAQEELFDEKEAVISTVSNIASAGGSSPAEVEGMISWVSNFIPEDENPAEPMSEILYPILSTAADAVRSNLTGEGAVVGVIGLTFFWRDLIKDILPQDSGLVCVVHNDCHQSFTYQIDGPNAIYLGEGDLFHSKYKHMEVAAELAKLDSFKTRSSTYSGPFLCDSFCAYHLHIYPSTDMEADYISKDPIHFTVAAVLIFAFTSAVFLIYDKCVEKRQRKVMFKALTSSANVAMLEEKVKERTNKLELSNQQLEEANQRVVLASAKQLQHFACMSHEIRTPLNCIIGVSSLLQETEMNPAQRDSVQMIVDSGDLLLAVVNDVLDFSRLESGKVDMSIRECSLQDTLNSVVRSMEAKCQLKGVSIRTTFGPDVGEFLSTDKQRLQQILFNLLGNAVKFSKDGGNVDLSVRLCTPSDPQDSDRKPYSGLATTDSSAREAEPAGRVIRFVVKDYGTGIEEEHFPDIFQPFLQAKADNVEHLYGGTGLGLAITSRLVEGLNGSITVDSVVGEWSEFTVDLPGDGAQVDVKAISTNLHNARVMVILVAVDQDGVLVGQMKTVFQAYDVGFLNFSSMLEVQKGSGVLPRDRTYVCLIHEDLFDEGIYKELRSLLPGFLLFSFGPSFNVKEAAEHYHSLCQVLPSVLMNNIRSQLQHQHSKSSPAPREDLTEAKESSSSSDSSPYSSLRILIAEDNKVNQKVLVRMLKQLGIRNVSIAENGQVAVNREAAEEFDVVLMDMQMPVMDGLDACRLISKRQGGHSRPKVVFVTAHVSPSFEAECLEAGGYAFLPKPFRLCDIEKCIESL